MGQANTQTQKQKQRESLNSGNKTILHALGCLSNDRFSHFTSILIPFNQMTSPNSMLGKSPLYVLYQKPYILLANTCKVLSISQILY